MTSFVDQLRAALVEQICVEVQDMSVRGAAAWLDTHPSRVSRLRQRNVALFSLDALFAMMRHLRYDIEITLRPRKYGMAARDTAPVRVVRATSSKSCA